MINVIRTKAVIFRNLKEFKFVPKIDAEACNKIFAKISQALPDFKQISIDDLNQSIKTKLYELQSTRYPNVLVSNDASVGIKFFDTEHLSIISSNYGYDKQVVANVKEVATQLGNKISFAYNDDYGYLMSSLVNVGSGLKIECDILLSGLTSYDKIEQLRLNLQKLGYTLKSTPEKQVYNISTMCNLGFTTDQIFTEFDKMIAKVQELEIESLKSVNAYNTDASYDAYVRAYGIANSAYLMTIEELNAIIKHFIQGYNLGYTEVKKEVIQNLIQYSINNYNLHLNKMEKETQQQIQISKQVKKILKGE